jgi:hypothetical protein
MSAIGYHLLEGTLMVSLILLISMGITGIIYFILKAFEYDLDILSWVIGITSANSIIFPILLYVYLIG